MFKKIISRNLLLVLSILVTVSSFALSLIAPTNLLAQTTEEPISCFDYYNFGSVSVDLTSNVSQTVSGIPITFSGQAINKNSYPILDGAVYERYPKHCTLFRKELSMLTYTTYVKKGISHFS